MHETLVIGGTGKQGGATARALLAAGRPVRALVRNPESDAAKALEARGAVLVPGDLGDPASLREAATGVGAVFSVQTPDMADLMGDSEVVHGRNLIAAALAAGVPQFVHTSVSGAGEPGRGQDSAHSKHYWDSKAALDEAVRTAGFAHWTILKPTTFMENLLGWSPMFGNWERDGVFITIFHADTVLGWVAVDDIGAAAAAAIADPAKFDRVNLELAGDRRTMAELAAILSGVLGRRIEAPVLTAEEAVERGMMPVMVGNEQQINRVGSPARPEFAHALGLTTTDLPTWAARTFTA
jgi:uncharacterized protein YbjT (DUF2867 family)